MQQILFENLHSVWPSSHCNCTCVKSRISRSYVPCALPRTGTHPLTLLFYPHRRLMAVYGLWSCFLFSRCRRRCVLGLSAVSQVSPFVEELRRAGSIGGSEVNLLAKNVIDKKFFRNQRIRYCSTQQFENITTGFEEL